MENPCCKRPSIANMDYKYPVFAKYGEPVEMRVNRVCLTCLTHWSGSIDNPTQYTGKEWDKLLAEAFKKDFLQAWSK